MRYLVSLLLVLASMRAPSLTVKVESPQGAPRIVVNGKPVRARMFYGGPGWTALPIGLEGKLVDFEFVATDSADNGTMHFRFGPSAGEVRLDDIRVTDLDDKKDVVSLCDFSDAAMFEREWTHWPVGEANTVGTISVDPTAGREGGAGLLAKLIAPPDGKWPDFHIYHHTNLHFVQGHHYRVQVWAQANPARSLNIEFHRPGKTFVRIGGPPDPFVAQIKLAAKAGVNFVTFPAPLPWPPPGQKEDWEPLDTLCNTILMTNPEALLIPRVPMSAPKWWLEAHRDEAMQWEDGHRGMAVPASPVYRKEAAARLTAFIEHVEAKFGDHVAGYHPDGQNTGEWFYQDSWLPLLNGYAPADQAGWQRWLKADKPVPSPAERHAAPNGIFRDAVKEDALIQWGRYQQDAMAQCVCELAKAARTASKGRKLVLFFYGYVHELAGIPNGPATSGHYALRQVLNSPDIDILCAPIAYFDRGLGGSSPSMTAAESVALAGKMWLNEDDTHTYIATGNPPGYLEHANSLEETNGELTRNVAQEALRNFGTWWMDLTQTGWYNDPGMWDQMLKLDAVDQELLDHPTPFKPDIAVVVDEEAMLHVAAKAEAVTRPAVYAVRKELGRMGAPYGQYLLDDVVAGKVKAKLYVFLNAWTLTAEQRQKVADTTRGSVCVWCYAPGFVGQQQAVCGFKLEPIINVKAIAKPMGPALTKSFGVPFPLLPQFKVVDAREGEVLAVYPDGSVAVAMRGDNFGGTRIFAGVPGLTTELLRLAAKQAGAHLYCDAECNLWANGHFIAVHASQEGPLTIDTGCDGTVYDVMKGGILSQGRKLSLNLKRGETKVLKVKRKTD